MLRATLTTVLSGFQSFPVQSPKSLSYSYGIFRDAFCKYFSSSVDDVVTQLVPQYPEVILKGNKKLQRLLTSSTRYQPITERQDYSDIPTSVYNDSINLGKYTTLYCDAVILKDPQELSVYHQFFYYVRPSTVIELGTFSRASAAWFADAATIQNLNCHGTLIRR